MESSKIFGGTEECQSSESGWTMYIGSPMAGDDDDESHSFNGGTRHAANKKHYVEHDEDSDDSMASDASSWPSSQCENGENGQGGMAYFKHDGKKDKYKSEKKEIIKPAMEKQRGIRRKEEREELVFVAKRASSTPLQSGGKVKRNNWMGKRK